MPLQPVDYRAPDAHKLFAESLRETGFGVLTNHPLQREKVDAIYEQWKAFFNTERKRDYQMTAESNGGYFPPEISETAKGETVKDIKEFFHFYPGRTDCPTELQAAVTEYHQQANALAAELLTWVEQNSPAEVSDKYSVPLSDMIENSEQTLLRILHYPPIEGGEAAGAIRAAAHEDINLLTVLPASNEPGLQVKLKSGEWMDVPCDFSYLIVNIGDMLQEASGGYYPSTSHRVINPSETRKSEARLSLPLFLHPRPDVVLSERHTADSYLQERLRELRGG